MGKKECTSVFGLAVAIASFLGFVGCGVICFALSQALKMQRHDLSEARAQIAALNQALGVQRHDLSETREQLAAANHQIVGSQKESQTFSQQLTEIQAKLRESKTVNEMPSPLVPIPMMAPDIPGADSIEGKLLAEGKNWERTVGQPIAGGYVQDILVGRLNQPKGRGRIGTVVAMTADAEGRPVATVDFGHGYVVGISTSELSPVHLVAPDMR
jgi:hypothetical protein